MQLREYATQGSISALLLLSGNWFAGICHACYSAFNARTFLRGKYMLDVTEIFQAINREKNVRFAKLVFLLLSFVLIIYRCAHLSPLVPSSCESSRCRRWTAFESWIAIEQMIEVKEEAMGSAAEKLRVEATI